MNYIYGKECEKAIQEYRNLTKDIENERQWANKHLDLYKRISDKNDKSGTYLTITRNDMKNTIDFYGLYEIYKFDDDSDDNLYDAVLI